MSWTLNDARHTREFLEKCPNFLKRLRAKVPRCEGKTNEERATTGSQRQGAQDILEEIERCKEDPRTGSTTDPDYIK